MIKEAVAGDSEGTNKISPAPCEQPAQLCERNSENETGKTSTNTDTKDHMCS